MDNYQRTKLNCTKAKANDRRRKEKQYSGQRHLLKSGKDIVYYLSIELCKPSTDIAYKNDKPSTQIRKRHYSNQEKTNL